jgi:hypothetical protein
MVKQARGVCCHVYGSQVRSGNFIWQYNCWSGDQEGGIAILTDVAQIPSVVFLWGVSLSFCVKIRVAKFIVEWDGAEGISEHSLASSPS